MHFEKIIFFDLETSSLHKVGQILNFCFVVVDRSWNECARLKGTVAISRIELPDPMAIQATGIDVIEHQKTAHYSEAEASEVIRKFLNTWATETTAISGYNTENFDIPFLRTTLLRNGLYEYSKAHSRDMMVLTKALLAKNLELRRHYIDFLSGLNNSEADQNLSITLEKIATFFGLLKEAQAHESEFDVDLVISLAKKLANDFGTNIFEFTPYELFPLHHRNGVPYILEVPSRSLSEATKTLTMVYLKTEGKASLWAPLDEFQVWYQSPDEKKLPIRRFKHDEASMWAIREDTDKELLAIGEKAIERLKDYTTSDLYGKKDVYIEQWIYDLSYEDKNLLCACIQRKSSEYHKLSSQAVLLYKRYLIAMTPEDDCFPAYEEIFKKYCMFRYGGGMKLYSEYEKPSERPLIHLTYTELLKEFPKAYEKFKGQKGEGMKKQALVSLQTFYEKSRIAHVFS